MFPDRSSLSVESLPQDNCDSVEGERMTKLEIHLPRSNRLGDKQLIPPDSCTTATSSLGRNKRCVKLVSKYEVLFNLKE